MKKKTIAKEIKLFQKAALMSMLIGVVVCIGCLIVFNPWKFDSAKYQQVGGQSYRSSSVGLSTPSYFPAWWVDGFFDYCDGEIRFSADFPQASYRDRKEYLLHKSFTYGIWTALLVLIGVFGYRYIKSGQAWVNENLQ